MFWMMILYTCLPRRGLESKMDSQYTASAKVLRMDKRYFFMNGLLERLGRPAFFCHLVAGTLRVVAALIVLLSLTVFFKVGKLTFDMSPNQAPGGILFEAFFLLAVYAAVHAFIARARDIDAVKADDSYAITTLALLLKLFGEAYCAFVGLMGIGGGLFVWFTAQKLGNALGALVRALFPGVGDDPSFMGGIEFMAGSVLIGIGVLVVSYAASQALTIWFRPVRNGVHQTPTAEISHPFRSRFGS